MVALLEKRDGFWFVPFLYPFYCKNAILINENDRSIEDYQVYISRKGIKQAEIIMPDINFVKNLPVLKHLKISPACNAPPDFDFSPLYDVEEIRTLHCLNQYGDNGQYISTIEYDKINGLVYLIVSANKGSKNYNKVKTLKSLAIGGHKGQYRDLSDLFCSSALDTLELNGCHINSLNGIDISQSMQCLYLYYNRALQDINALSKVKSTLKALRIQNCPKITDFSVLGELENLELLELSGSNSLPDLSFIKSLKKLKTFVFNFNVLDGDLTPCLNLEYVYSEKNRKHYNLKDMELPKIRYVRGNETIDEWRRLE